MEVVRVGEGLRGREDPMHPPIDGGGGAMGAGSGAPDSATGFPFMVLFRPAPASGGRFRCRCRWMGAQLYAGVWICIAGRDPGAASCANPFIHQEFVDG